MPTSKTFRAKIVREGSTCFIPLTFDPKSFFGKMRAPVKVTVNGYTYRSTIAAMGGPPCIPLRKSHREAAGLEGSETIDVRLDLDTAERAVTPPADFMRALKAAPGAVNRWRELSYSHQREHVDAIESAKKPETRARRIAGAVKLIRQATVLLLALAPLFTIGCGPSSYDFEAFMGTTLPADVSARAIPATPTPTGQLELMPGEDC